MYQFFICFFGVIFLGYFLERFLISILGFKIFRLMIIPGIIIHETSHAIVAKIFGSQIRSFHVFKIEGGEIKYSQPIFPLITNPLISLAPILGCSAALYLTGIFLGFDFHHFGLHFLLKDLIVFLAPLKANLAKSIIFLYLVLSLTSSMAPSKRDFKNAMLGLILLIFLIVLIFYFFPSSNIIFLKIGFLYLIGLYMLILAFIISLFFWLIKSLILKFLPINN